jgi:5-formyltetrahydrofolate cyclo-ligase
MDDAKKRLREAAREARRAAHRGAGREAAAALVRHWREAARQGLVLPAAALVAGYWPVRDEIDVRGLLGVLIDDGHAVALPVVAGPERLLAFRRWRPGDALAAGAFGLSEPQPQAPAVTPQALIVPLLAFDRAGYRLGYGRGYYDRTLQALRAAGPVLAVGVAFAAQEVAELPRDGFDQRLDWIVTERGARAFGG